MKMHDLKTLPVYFDAVLRGDKPFEVRNNDRDFQTGDMLHLREWDPSLLRCSPPWPGTERPTDLPKDHDGYTGRELFATVSYTLHDPTGKFGLQTNHVVMGLSQVRDPDKVLQGQSSD